MTDSVNLKAVGPKVVVKVKEIEGVTAGGIHLPESSLSKEQNAATEGILINVGSTAFDYLEEKDRPKVGDCVFFVKFAGIGKEIDEETYRIINDEDIYAVKQDEGTLKQDAVLKEKP